LGQSGHFAVEQETAAALEDVGGVELVVVRHIDVAYLKSRAFRHAGYKF